MSPYLTGETKMSTDIDITTDWTLIGGNSDNPGCYDTGGALTYVAVHTSGAIRRVRSVYAVGQWGGDSTTYTAGEIDGDRGGPNVPRGTKRYDSLADVRGRVAELERERRERYGREDY